MGLVCRYCGSALVVDGLALVAATASPVAGRVCPSNRGGHDVSDGVEVQLGLDLRPICPTCGPLDAPLRHSICHPVPGLRVAGCGHPLAEHTTMLDCRTCGAECGRG